MHAVNQSDDLGEDLAAVELWSSERPEACSYRSDQTAARGGWCYCAELAGGEAARRRQALAAGARSRPLRAGIQRNDRRVLDSETSP